MLCVFVCVWHCVRVVCTLEESRTQLQTVKRMILNNNHTKDGPADEDFRRTWLRTAAVNGRSIPRLVCGLAGWNHFNPKINRLKTICPGSSIWYGTRRRFGLNLISHVKIQACATSMNHFDWSLVIKLWKRLGVQLLYRCTPPRGFWRRVARHNRKFPVGTIASLHVSSWMVRTTQYVSPTPTRHPLHTSRSVW